MVSRHSDATRDLLVCQTGAPAGSPQQLFPLRRQLDHVVAELEPGLGFLDVTRGLRQRNPVRRTQIGRTDDLEAGVRITNELVLRSDLEKSTADDDPHDVSRLSRDDFPHPRAAQPELSWIEADELVAG